MVCRRGRKGGRLLVDAAGYRAKAAEMRQRAKSTRDPVVHQELLFLAQQYDLLAQRAQNEEQKPPPR